MSEKNIESPKAFISYSWSSHDHESWVLQLASELEESGVHVIIDKWDLREGADKYSFMEKMVTDKSIRKVIVICDKTYAEKADVRKGGVGTETQIISQEIYDQIDPSDQEQKFVAIIAERDQEGNPYIPTFLKSRIYIDMSDPVLRNDSFEQIVRWVFDKPLHKRPQRGKPPSYLFEETQITLGTAARFRHAINDLRENRSTAPGSSQEYFETFSQNLESFRVDPEEGKIFDDQIVENIEAFLPHRNELIDIIMAITRFRAELEMYALIHSFLESLLPYAFWPRNRTSWTKSAADNFKFMFYEIFIYIILIWSSKNGHPVKLPLPR